MKKNISLRKKEYMISHGKETWFVKVAQIDMAVHPIVKAYYGHRQITLIEWANEPGFRSYWVQKLADARTDTWVVKEK